ncbi:MAG: Gfo/Idh/MocA family oxidoreductase [Flavobacteriales bacterium]|nr:Gfo/Idh/MocA family oxidoreductase [Flavobacteriales bacterium]MDG1780326.1 Gfo/Idh/MocA family oxidoreductase [Flavobacteriales bacterium]
MLKIGVLGAGHLGKIHIKCIQQLTDVYELVGFFDPDESKRVDVSTTFGIHPFDSVDELINASDVVDVVTPTLSHYDCASLALRSSKHVFIEKPITNTLDEAKSLLRLSEEANMKIQVGHVERFNPGYVAALPSLNQPRFIEAHRLSQFNPRGTDVSVVLDLMIHDIDIVLSTVKANVRKVSASGVAVVSDNPDIANARLEFDNGCVANLTASRISLKNMRKSRFFQKDAYIAVDFLDRNCEIVRMKTVEGEPDPFAVSLDLGAGKGFKEIMFEKPEIPEDSNAIRDELASLAIAINDNTTPIVTVNDGFQALEVAHRILEKMKTSGEIEL